MSHSLESLPPEILFRILSHLDEADLHTLQELSRTLHRLIAAEELWKYLLRAQLHSRQFPSASRSSSFHSEFAKRRDTRHKWRHARVVRTKYAVGAGPIGQAIGAPAETSTERLVFDYPRCAAYQDGTVVLLHLQGARRSRQRLTYIPCTTPHGCSTMDFTIGAAVFGRFDGRVFGKLLSSRAYLTPVTEFGARHIAAVTCIAARRQPPGTDGETTTSPTFDCVSGSEDGELLWWRDTKCVGRCKVATGPLWRLQYWRNYTVALDDTRAYVVDTENMKYAHSYALPVAATALINVAVDFGNGSLILVTTTHIFVVPFDTTEGFGTPLEPFTLPEGQTITLFTMDKDTSLRPRERDLAGGDGCYAAVLTSQNEAIVLDVRSAVLSPVSRHTFPDPVAVLALTPACLIAAQPNSVEVHDAANGDTLKVLQRTDPQPQFLRVSQGRIVTGSGTTLHLLETMRSSHGDDQGGSGRSRGSTRRSHKWTESVDAQLDAYAEDEQHRSDRRAENERLLQEYGGDVVVDSGEAPRLQMQRGAVYSTGDSVEDDEDVQLRIALLESEAASAAVSADVSDEHDAELEEVLRLSQEQAQAQAQAPPPHAMSEDEELQLALALSLSELN
ncbi:SCF ubiquitin ligase complex subunit [Maudiozyma humilis]|uniref:SCF ubiquitin ligase complex subunit n=1 Tax=Maudiozyma humilis TaxID=51915 RepID=A0AAV5S088_MAUHU|nr:SCF ubiquitin ligase complex subunit [Kazachstania humilis]